MSRKGERAMEKPQGFTDHVMLYVKTLVKWLLAAALIGTVGGAVGSLFRLGVEYATELRTEVPALLYALPLAGVLIVALYRFLRTQGVGTNAVLDAVHQGRELPILLIPAIFLATLLTHLAGGSAGREGAALQIGGDLGEHFGKMLRMDDKDCRLATLCGMSALFSALFVPAQTAAVDIARGHGGIVAWQGKKYGVYRHTDGTLFAVDIRCPHRGCELTWNDDEKSWDCPCHGSRFDYTGRRLSEPAKAALKPCEDFPQEI